MHYLIWIKDLPGRTGSCQQSEDLLSLPISRSSMFAISKLATYEMYLFSFTRESTVAVFFAL